MLKFLGIAILCAAATVFLRESESPLSRLLPVAGGICILVFAFSSLGGSVRKISELAEGTAVSEYSETLMRALGIGYAAELTADVCRSCSAESAASAIILLGKAELAALACPLLIRLLGAALSILA